jgi:hypothetical protein
MHTEARRIALGGMMAALASVIMGLGGVIPVATYVVPMLCMFLLQFVLKTCGRRIAWAWYGAVSALGLLLCPDKEAAAVFLALGYYPIVKPKLDKLPLPWLGKGLLFNAVILLLYWLLMNLFGLQQVVQDFEELGIAMTAALLVMGNVVFLLMDILLGRRFKKR